MRILFGNAFDFNGFDFKRSKSFSDLAQRLLWLDALKACLSETNRLLALFLVTLADNQNRHKFSDEFDLLLYCTFRLGVTCSEVLK